MSIKSNLKNEVMFLNALGRDYMGNILPYHINNLSPEFAATQTMRNECRNNRYIIMSFEFPCLFATRNIPPYTEIATSKPNEYPLPDKLIRYCNLVNLFRAKNPRVAKYLLPMYCKCDLDDVYSYFVFTYVLPNTSRNLKRMNELKSTIEIFFKNELGLSHDIIDIPIMPEKNFDLDFLVWTCNPVAHFTDALNLYHIVNAACVSAVKTANRFMNSPLPTCYNLGEILDKSFNNKGV